MLIIFCSDVLNSSAPDLDYADEWAAAQAAGFTTALLKFEVLVDEGNALRATRSIPTAEYPTPALYRGWMMERDSYQALCTALESKGYHLITDVQAYQCTHELPAWYPLLAKQTPASVWLPWSGHIDMDAIMAKLLPLGQRPVILKDYVKSRKHEWNEACFIPAAHDRQAVERVIRRFVELQGTQLQGGLVFREFIDFVPLGNHAISGMPLTKEWRLFILDRAIVAAVPYWEGSTYDDIDMPLDQFTEAIQRVPSRFFTMDVAQCVDGSWMIIELGDGQVAGLPDHVDRGEFYRNLRLWADRISLSDTERTDLARLAQLYPDLHGTEAQALEIVHVTAPGNSTDPGFFWLMEAAGGQWVHVTTGASHQEAETAYNRRLIKRLREHEHALQEEAIRLQQAHIDPAVRLQRLHYALAMLDPHYDWSAHSERWETATTTPDDLYEQLEDAWDDLVGPTLTGEMIFPQPLCACGSTDLKQDAASALFRLLWLCKPENIDFSDMYKTTLFGVVSSDLRFAVLIDLFKYRPALRFYCPADVFEDDQADRPIRVSTGIPGADTSVRCTDPVGLAFFEFVSQMALKKHTIYGGNNFVV